MSLTSVVSGNVTESAPKTAVFETTMSSWPLPTMPAKREFFVTQPIWSPCQKALDLFGSSAGSDR